ncbi:hypothetical protein [Allomuricauda sp. F6463D]|uniref:hypothetical protein n=1 Tax=Allomuricauda sp. F6463D TaxID=2926409 RepID=UPI001FF1505F|nr:hypothetical protein [Muricauda sp. F6463D]MCK0160876.1 hypothetical protein [Muricauda sp. F6463D]
MHLLTIIWTLLCALIIIGYPLYLLKRSATTTKRHGELYEPKTQNTVELLSFDIREQLPGWSITLDVPQITEEILNNNPILFYLESDESCLKLPLNNATMGYKVNVYKNVGKVYVTFKSVKDGVSNFYIPTWHLKKLKVLIIKSKDKRINGDWDVRSNGSLIHKNLKKSGINVNDYEDVLGYFSNITSIDFKGHYIARIPNKQFHNLSKMHRKEHELSNTA